MSWSAANENGDNVFSIFVESSCGSGWLAQAFLLGHAPDFRALLGGLQRMLGQRQLQLTRELDCRRLIGTPEADHQLRWMVETQTGFASDTLACDTPLDHESLAVEPEQTVHSLASRHNLLADDVM